jgi:serine/threonine protein kinase
MDTIGRYRTERVLGSGTFATVWLAHDDQLDVDVAIKVLADNWARDEDIRRRFLDEARILWRADSPHIVRIHHLDELADGRPYFVMAYADRGSLEDRMRQRAIDRRQFTVDESVAIAADIARGLEASHALGIVHRDLKPSAVLFRSEPASGGETLVLVDFGIAKSLATAKTTVATGTPHYMAPEQAEGHVDERTDVYSAAVILYELLAGRVPYAFDSLTEVVKAQASGPPTDIALLRPDVPPDLAAVIHRALSLDPDGRFATARDWRDAITVPPPPAPSAMAETMGPAEFQAQLEEATGPPVPPASATIPGAPSPPPPPAGPPPGGPPPSSDQPRRKRRRRVWLPILGLAAAAAAVIVGVVALTGGTEPGPDITEVFLDPVAFPGVDAFTPSVVPVSAPPDDDGSIATLIGLLRPAIGSLSEIDFPDFDLPDPPPPPTDGDATTTSTAPLVNTVAGSAPGLYGGTNLLDTCNKQQLIDFLLEQVDKGTAWAEVEGLSLEELPDYINSLTDVILQADTRVINHGFRDGRANPINSVLQAGTAVLIDNFGVPRVRCMCGNPLLPAIELSVDVTVQGTAWPGFSLSETVAVQPVASVTEFELQDIVTGRRFFKPVGAAAPGTTTTTRPPATTTTIPITTTTVVVGTGDVQATLSWIGDADLDLHVIDPEGFEIFFNQAQSPSGGLLDVDQVPDCGADISNHVENIFWPEGESIPGTYQAFVVHYDGSCGAPAEFLLELKIDGVAVARDTGSLAVGEQSAPISARSGG